MSAKNELHGVLIDNVSMDEAVERVLTMLDGDRTCKIYTPNSEILMQATRNSELKNILNEADLLIPDGAGVILASKILGKSLKQKVSGIDLVRRLLMNTDKRPTSFFIFGSKPGVAEQASINLLTEFPRVNILGFRNGYFKNEDIPDILKQINHYKPEVVLVGLGAPRQEEFIHKYASQLNCKVLMGIGGAIDVFAGEVSLAPEFIRRAGFEWLFRLIKEPFRYKRMLDLPRFMWLSLRVRLSRKKAPEIE